MKNEVKVSLALGAFLLALAVCIGAFGAHGLKNIVTGKYLTTYQTGVTYHYYHAFGLIILGLIKGQWEQVNIRPSLFSFGIGILLFSFNCYFYALSQTKFFAMVVPLGGVLFIIGWFTLFIQIIRKIK